MERKEVSTCGISRKDLHESASSAHVFNLVLDQLPLLGCPREMSELGVSVKIVNIDCGALGTARLLPTGSVVLKDTWHGTMPSVPLCLPLGRQTETLTVQSALSPLFDQGCTCSGPWQLQADVAPVGPLGQCYSEKHNDTNRCVLNISECSP